MRNDGLIKGLADQLEIHKVPLFGRVLVEGFKDVPQDFWRKLLGKIIEVSFLKPYTISIRTSLKCRD